MKKVHEGSLDIIGADLDAKVYCSCGVEFYITQPSVPYRCVCGKLYQGEIVIFQIDEEDKDDNFEFVARPIPNLYENAEGNDEVQ